MSRRGQYLLFTALVIADTVGAAAGLLLAAYLLPSVDLMRYLNAIQYGLIAYPILFAALRLYDLETVLEDSQEYATVATGCTYAIIALVVINAVVRRLDFEPIWLLGGWAGTVFMAALARFSMRRVVRFFRGQGHLITRAVIIGADEQGRTIARQFKSVADSGVRVVGFLDDFLPAGTPVQDGLTVLGHPGALANIAQEHRVAEVVVVPGAVAWETFQEILERYAFAETLKIRVSPGYYDLLATTPRVAHRNFVPLMVIDHARLTGFDLLLKIGIDYGIGLITLIVTLPIMLLVALWLRIVNTGSILYTRTVLGQSGKTFSSTLFRVEDGKPLSRFLRDTALDHLPLLFSIPTGQMSLIGPRPIPEDKRGDYQRWLSTIVTVKPGVSGPWAVVPVSSLEEEMRAAIFYVRNWTIWLDLQISIQTLLVILRRRWERLTEG
jgi:lipopolysaccharide/colanic/teichoic acid biosynthesis glycosyltransferase